MQRFQKRKLIGNSRKTTGILEDIRKQIFLVVCTTGNYRKLFVQFELRQEPIARNFLGENFLIFLSFLSKKRCRKVELKLEQKRKT